MLMFDMLFLQGPSGGQKGEKGEPGEAGKRVSSVYLCS